jgi:hypothetical protein
MKTYFAMTLALAASSLGIVACVGAPAEEVESNAAPIVAEAEGHKVNATEVRFLSEEEASAERLTANSISACTPAELANCRRQDEYGSGCEIYNGRVTCLFW